MGKQKNTGEKPVLVPFCPPLNSDKTRVYTAGGQRKTSKNVLGRLAASR
jgi:hypothetical protein